MATTLLIWSRRLGVQSASLTLIRCQRAGSAAREGIGSRASCVHRYDKWGRIDISRQYSSTSPNLARCRQDGCKGRAGFGWASDRLALYCSFHMRPNMEDVRHKRCEHPGCGILRPCFGYVRKEGIMCLTHKLPGMIDVVTHRCEYEGCNILKPAFNVPGGKARYCDKHRTANMIDVANRRCGHEGCDVIKPHFGYPFAKGKFVDNLNLSGMKLQKYTKCQYNENSENKQCMEIARFGSMLGEPVYCDKHSLSCMKDVVSDRCSKHKLEGMVNWTRDCELKGCRKKASFGMPGSGLQCCRLHKLAGMLQYKGRIEVK